jgi:hypothetical protein
MSVFHYYDFGYCETFIFDDFLINQIKEGSIIGPEHSEVLNNIIKKHFGDNPVIYISNRIMSYSVNPMTYLDTAKIKNLVAIVVVTQDRNFKKNAEYEKNFFDKPFEVFSSLSQAIAWVHKTIEEV